MGEKKLIVKLGIEEKLERLKKKRKKRYDFFSSLISDGIQQAYCVCDLLQQLNLRGNPKKIPRGSWLDQLE